MPKNSDRSLVEILPQHDPDTHEELLRRMEHPERFPTGFVRIPLPHDRGITSPVMDGAAEATTMYTQMGVDEQRYMFQTALDPRFRDRRVQEALFATDTLTPDDLLKNPPDYIATLDYIHAIIEVKKYRTAAERGEMDGAEQAKIDECWRRSILCNIRSFSLEPADLLAVEQINGYFKRGLADKHPEEMARLLETCVKMRVGKRKIHRFEFFDALYDFQTRRGRTSDVIKFVRENFEIFLMMDIDSCLAFSDVLKRHPQADDVRMALIWRTYEKTFGGRAGLGMAEDYIYYSGNVRPALIEDFVVNCCIRARGDFSEAKKAMSTYGGFVRDQDLAVAENIQAHFDDLIPPFTSSGREARENLGDPSDEVAKMSAVAAIQNLTKARAADTRLHPLLVNAIRDLNFQKALMVMRMMFADDDLPWISYYSHLHKFLETFVSPENQQAGAIVENIEAILEEDQKRELRIPIELKTVCIARLVEALYGLGRKEEVIEVCQRRCTAAGVRMIRGTVYYFAKTCFETMREHPERAALVVKTATAELAQFEGTTWEVELWRDYLIPIFPEHEDSFCVEVRNYNPFKVLDSIIANKDVGNGEVYVLKAKIMAMADRRHLSRLQPAVLEMNAHAQGLTEKWGRIIQKINNEAIETFMKMGWFDDVEAVIRSIPNYKDDLALRRILCVVLLNEKGLTRERFDEVNAIIGDDENLGEEMRRRIENAMRVLKLTHTQELPCSGLLARLVEAREGLEIFAGNDGARMAFMFSNLRASSEMCRESLLRHRDEEAFTGPLFAEARRISGGPLSDIFGIAQLNFQNREGGGLAVRCELRPEDEDSLTREVVEVQMNKNLEIVGVECACPPETEACYKLLLRLLEACLLEEMRVVVENEPLTWTAEVIEGGQDLRDFRKRVAAFHSQKDSPEISIESGGLALRNQKIAEFIMADIEDLSKSADFPSDDEVIGLIGRYLELIQTCRDIDDPINCYHSRIDPRSPFYKHIKYLRIFSESAATAELAEMGVSTNEIPHFDERNNFSGYYQLMVYHPKKGELSISVFLDDKGRAYIPGIPRKHPLYDHLWLLTLESLAAKVVPELGPYTHIFKSFGRHPKTPFRALGIAKIPDEAGVDRRKRLSCAVLVVQGQPAFPTRTPKQKLLLLDDISSTFALIELGSKDITRWPMFVRDDVRRYRSVSGVFVRRGRKNYADVKVLSELFGVDLSEVKVKEVEGKHLAKIDDLPPEVKDRLIREVLIQSRSGRAYRMPVKFGVQSYEIRNIEGVDYFLVPAKYKKKPYIVEDGKIFRLVEVGPYTRLDIEGITYLATPWRMSEIQKEVYAATATRDVDLGEKRVTYAVLFDPSKNRVVAYTCFGAADKSPGGEYLDRNVRRAYEIHRGGRAAIMLDPKVRKQFGDREDLRELFFEVDTNSGYRIGTLRPVWSYLVAERGTTDLSLRLLLDGMKERLAGPALAEFEAALAEIGSIEVADEEESAEVEETKAGADEEEAGRASDDDLEDEDDVESSARVSADRPKKGERKRPKESVRKGVKPPSARQVRDARIARAMAVLDKDVPYQVDPEKKESRDFAGLLGIDLYVLSPDDPLFEGANHALNPASDEIIVTIGSPTGRFSKVRRSLLITKEELRWK